MKQSLLKNKEQQNRATRSARAKGYKAALIVLVKD